MRPIHNVGKAARRQTTWVARPCPATRFKRLAWSKHVIASWRPRSFQSSNVLLAPTLKMLRLWGKPYYVFQDCVLHYRATCRLLNWNWNLNVLQHIDLRASGSGFCINELGTHNYTLTLCAWCCLFKFLCWRHQCIEILVAFTTSPQNTWWHFLFFLNVYVDNIDIYLKRDRTHSHRDWWKGMSIDLMFK